MTQHLPSTSQAKRFAIIGLPDHGPPPDNAIMHGAWPAVMEQIPDSTARNDAIEEAAKAVVDAVEAEERRDEALATTARTIADTAALLTNRLDAFVARRDERIRRDAEREEEEEQQRIADELASLPDPDNPDAHTPGSEIHPAKADPGNPTDDQAPIPGEPTEPEDPPDPQGSAMPQPTAISLW